MHLMAVSEQTEGALLVDIILSGNDELWVDKYKPKGGSELVGNTTTIATLKQWLFQWEAVHLR
jgi:hypothetical protein